MTDIVILSLGIAPPYGVEKRSLLRGLADVGWRRGSGVAWLPPAGRRQADGIEALHQYVQPAPGFEAGNLDPSWQELPHFVAAPHLGNRAWELA